MTRNKLYMCHDEFELCNIGDEVLIQKSRPFSKRKHWKVHSWIKREPSALWFKIHPEYNISEEDKARLAEQVNFDYRFEQEAFEFEGKEIFNIQEGLLEAEIYPQRVEKTLSDQLLTGTLINRAVQKSPKEKFMDARAELARVIETEQKKRERFGLPSTWEVDDEPGTVTVARMNVRTAQNNYERHQAELQDIHHREEQAIKTAKGIPENMPAYPFLERFVKARFF
eukprot:CAMPEP_0117032886 /NCGR_PEP_ID=MMETSP0472-20121206/23542_1 /TAXON_ID=693140 ORGANISM="Tiarina fusus, Strain LIS" /NCGR_SAMPLE_ID=MMETSP0472 /ASSEMBLY_ACC=CAM_ASM_000603 /LENGTH=225 /DNA_ID=CAMNT_0004741655 /DNA_START=171 /DNA_END=848 /DNA_ORIENTATION=-